jgi:hypothetical protein
MTSSSVKAAAAKRATAEFFAPFTRKQPRRGIPPSITILSMKEFTSYLIKNSWVELTVK